MDCSVPTLSPVPIDFFSLAVLPLSSIFIGFFSFGLIPKLKISPNFEKSVQILKISTNPEIGRNSKTGTKSIGTDQSNLYQCFTCTPLLFCSFLVTW